MASESPLSAADRAMMTGNNVRERLGPIAAHAGKHLVYSVPAEHLVHTADSVETRLGVELDCATDVSKVRVSPHRPRAHPPLGQDAACDPETRVLVKPREYAFDVVGWQFDIAVELAEVREAGAQAETMIERASLRGVKKPVRSCCERYTWR